MLVKEFIPQFLVKNECDHVFGMSGANIEELFSEIQNTHIDITLAKNEYNAAMMAIGYYQKQRKPGFVLTTSGGAVMNTLPVLAEAYSTYNPLFLIAGQAPSHLEGKGAFQDSSGKADSFNLEEVLTPMTTKTHKLKEGDDLSEVMIELYKKAIQSKRPVALLIPKELFSTYTTGEEIKKVHSSSNSKKKDLSQVDQILNKSKKLLIVVGEEVEKSFYQKAVLNLAREYNAKIACVPTQKGFLPYNEKSFLGVIGMMGDKPVQIEFDNSDTLLFLGVQFNLLSSFGCKKTLAQKRIISIGTREDYIAENKLKFTCDPNIFLKKFQFDSPMNIQKTKIEHDENSYSLKSIMQKLNMAIKNGDDLFVDAGNTGASAVHHLKYKGDGVFYISLGMGGMGNSVGAAIGSCISSKNKTYTILGDGSFLMYGLEIHTALEKKLPLTFVIINNNSHGMCSTREEIFLNKKTDLNNFAPSYYAKGMREMFPGLETFEIKNRKELDSALETIKVSHKTSLLSITIENNELPPFNSFKKGNQK